MNSLVDSRSIDFVNTIGNTPKCYLIAFPINYSLVPKCDAEILSRGALFSSVLYSKNRYFAYAFPINEFLQIVKHLKICNNRLRHDYDYYIVLAEDFHNSLSVLKSAPDFYFCVKRLLFSQYNYILHSFLNGGSRSVLRSSKETYNRMLVACSVSLDPVQSELEFPP